jgi:heme/copper-type cytochrome/quinol oxidase subunit 2
MRHLATSLYILGVRLTSTLENAVHRRANADSERGSVTIEQVAWAVAIIAIVAIAAAAIRAYITTQVGRLG